MNGRKFIVLAIVLGIASPANAVGNDAATSLHPEEAIPDPEIEKWESPFADLVKRVQERLRQLGFDPGPVNGYFGEKTQAALVQFQLSRTVPASGALDAPTLAALHVEPEAQASAGSSQEEKSAESAPAAPADASTIHPAPPQDAAVAK